MSDKLILLVSTGYYGWRSSRLCILGEGSQ